MSSRPISPLIVTEVDLEHSGEQQLSKVAGLLVEARKAAGLPQSSLARASGVSQPNISDYENGKRSPTVRTLVSLLNACGYDLSIKRRM